MNEPLIYTKNGNLPESTLNYTQEWEDHIVCEVTLIVVDGTFVPKISKSGYLVFKEFYHDKETNELVKSNAHICLMQDQKLELTQGQLT